MENKRFPLGRSCLAVSLASIGLVVFLPVQPVLAQWLSWCVAAAVLAVAASCGAWLLRPGQASFWCIAAALWLLCIAVSVSLTAWRVDTRVADALHPDDIDKVSRVELRIVGLVRESSQNRSVEAEVLDSMPKGVPRSIQISWSAQGWQGPYGGNAPAADFPALLPGQVWRMALNLRPPSGARNPHGFDYEGHAFARGVRAQGSVRGSPVLLRDEPFHSIEVVAQRTRYLVRERMRAYLEGMRYGPVLLALAIGDQAGVRPSDWQAFNRAGISHLIAISGSHITMIAALGGIGMFWLWRRLRWKGVWLAERMPAQVAAAMSALLVAWLYCLLAGWGVPARRTFLMLAVIATAYAVRLQPGSSRILLLAAWLVVWMDPWAPMASGFWLSFGAVAILMLYGSRKDGGEPASQPCWVRWRRALLFACGLQLAVSFALMPVLGRLFHEVSLVSPLANAYAIPIISLLVTPLALLLAAASAMPGMTVAAEWLAISGHQILAWMMIPTDALVMLPAASIATAAVPWAITLLAIGGVVLALMPCGPRMRRAGWLLLLPAMFWEPKRPEEGGWRMAALDVGQGSAIVIQTRRHAFLFDAGVRRSPDSEEGSRTIAPYLKARGIRRLDAMIVSHDDVDHAGGASGVLQSLPVLQSYAPFDLQAWLAKEERLLGVPRDAIPRPEAMTDCVHGMRWTADGVSFSVIWPLHGNTVWTSSAGKPSKADSNANSCVLLVEGEHHSLLLTGDIGAAQERLLVERGLGRADIVLAAHHGSRGSSSEVLAQTLRARHVIAQAGMWNRFGHPHPAVERRWQREGAAFWRTDLDGAVSVESSSRGLSVTAERVDRPHYWQR
ncbi:DNA internalization-related competence protein ComEC/Rec2 [Paracandidimonas soli]|uniref:DNA internalization-related competence protein ComEC/Rec2 n=1 Tax=Paracandidimonas soli TaxID=1917182 RepID=UPI000A3FC57B